MKSPGVACTIHGFRNTPQVSCNLAAMDRALCEDDIGFMRLTLS